MKIVTPYNPAQVQKLQNCKENYVLYIVDDVSILSKETAKEGRYLHVFRRVPHGSGGY